MTVQTVSTLSIFLSSGTGAVDSTATLCSGTISNGEREEE